ncbi:hypothetical protein HQO82_04240 [Rhodococcus fascians]|nr:hypothetical protein [Rhodococcus fascians]MBY4113021.1 hypothetical protein [Rhodococcus fascians]
MTDGRRADSTRRKQRVITAIDQAAASGSEISASAIARTAGVDRSFLYRHPDLLAHLHLSQLSPATATGGIGPSVTRESLKADVVNARHTIARMAAHTKQLERKLSETLGEQAWRDSGLGAPTDIDQLQHRIIELEQHLASLADVLAERTSELEAARAANREMFAQINTP